MLYLLDANVLITAHNTYYALDQVPEFWAWLHYQGVNGKIKVPREMMDEVLAGNPDDLLYKWIREPRNRDALVLDENPNPPLIQKIVNEGYGKDLSDLELEQIGQDPFLVAHAMTSLNRCVVTTETSAPSKLRQNRKLPDVCTSFGVSCCDTFKLIRELKFTTSWDQLLSPSITETFQQELKLISKNDD